MTVRALGQMVPNIHPSAWVSEAAYVVGDVVLGEDSSVWPGVVIRGDCCMIRIGTRSHIEDNSVIHGKGLVEIENDVVVGHAVVVHCRTIGSNCLIGNNATILDRAVIGEFCLVAAGSLVRPNIVIPSGSFVSGVPGVVRSATPEQVALLRELPARQFQDGYGALMIRFADAGL